MKDEIQHDERRKGMEDLTKKIDTLVINQALIKSYIEKQFGGVDLAGTPVEGDVTRQLRELNQKVAIQNGRVTKLEHSKLYWVAYSLGVGGTIGLIISAVSLYLTWFRN